MGPSFVKAQMVLRAIDCNHRQPGNELFERELEFTSNSDTLGDAVLKGGFGRVKVAT